MPTAKVAGEPGAVKISLDDPTIIATYDPSGSLAVADAIPETAEAAYAKARQVALPARYNWFTQLVICGMGGSAISADLLRNFLFSKATVPVMVVRSSQLPATVGPNTLVIASSYSGNTAETLACYERAQELGARVVAISSGGKIQELSARDGTPFVPVKAGMQPRGAIGEMFYTLIGLVSQFEQLGIDPEEVEYSFGALRQVRMHHAFSLKTSENPSKALAQKLLGKLPIVFGVAPWTEAVAGRWKTQFNENSKLTAVFSVFPELSHNEIINLTTESAWMKENAHVIVLRYPDAESPIERAQIEICLEMISSYVHEITHIHGYGEGLLARQMSLVYLGDYLTLFLAFAQGIDPTPVPTITELKRRMGERLGSKAHAVSARLQGG